MLDEGSQFHKYYIEAFDWLLQDIMGNKELPFGGKHVIIGSDFRQTLPIVEKESQATHFRMSIKRSYLWAKFQKSRLISNERCRNEEWKNILLKIRSGEYESDEDGNITLIRKWEKPEQRISLQAWQFCNMLWAEGLYIGARSV